MHSQDYQPRVFITGASSKVGKFIAEAFASLGWNLVLHYHTSKEETENLRIKLLEYIKLLKTSIKIDLAQLDFSQSEQVSNFAFSDPVDLLINNAAIFENDNLLNLSAACTEKHLKINSIAPALLVKAFASQHIESLVNPGIINILDSDTKSAQTNFSSYHMSKSALWQLTKIAAKQLAPNIRSNGIALGQIVKNVNQSAKDFDNCIMSYPLQKKISEQNLRHALNYLVTNYNVTGSILHLDSGAGI